MNWLEITIHTASKGIDKVATALTANGFTDLVMADQAEFESFLEDNRQYWDYIDEQLQQQLTGLSKIQLYIEEADKESFDRLQALVEELRAKNENGKLGSLEMTVNVIAQTNWEESWKDNYPPQPVGQRLLVLPCWRSDEPTQGRLPVILDPGLTFGTGAHPSTQMVMEQMEKLVTPGVNCLDLGSGSGILSITALRLGAGSAVGVDIDPKAEDIARENAAYNGFGSPAFTALTGNVTEDKALMERLAQRDYQVVLVNIVADVIIGLCPVLPGFLSKDSVLILSGILDSREQDVKNALAEAGLTVCATHAKEEWRCITAKRSDV